MQYKVAPELLRIRQCAWDQAQQISFSVGETAPPVALHTIAIELKIKRIEFIPLLCTAGIGPVEDGYSIYINTRAPGAANIKKRCLDVSLDDFQLLNPRLRFNVAHEMAHVFFFNAVGG